MSNNAATGATEQESASSTKPTYPDLEDVIADFLLWERGYSPLVSVSAARLVARQYLLSLQEKDRGTSHE